ncbi:MAG: hypothetical protein IKC58_02000 [Clostridia bacterium]|nr:hypothetical protein [Clostridia bacterium]
MKRICLLMTIILLMLLLSGCNTTYYWKFYHNYEDIVEIKIVDMGDSSISFYPTKDDFHVIKEIDLKLVEDLCADISSIPYHFFHQCLILGENVF